MPWQKRNKKKIIIGVTGSFGSGKTTVAKMLKGQGVKVVDADKIAHNVLQSRTPAYKKIIKAFGRDILRPDQSIDRRKLASIVFSDKKLLKKLNTLVHPAVIARIKQEMREAREGVIILDAPLLIEAGLKNITDKLVVVKITRPEQLRRLIEKTHLSRKEILKRIYAQMSLSDKLRMADFVIDNNGTPGQTRKQAAIIRRLLWKS